MAPDVAVTSRVIEIHDELLRRWPLPFPADDCDKEERGRVLIVAGSREIPGAVVLAATASLRAGAGKVTVATGANIAQAVAFAVPESRVISLPETNEGDIAPDVSALDEIAEKIEVVLLGLGLRNNSAACDLADAVLATFSKARIILDAGAMGVACTPRNMQARFSSEVLLTPHAGEMAGLTGADKDSVATDPQSLALTAARTWGAVVALKGATTYIAAPNGQLWRHEGGNVGLATSGSGDVLAGIIAGLAARGAPLEQASAWGVALHARAGAKLAARLGPLGYLAREIPAEIPALMAALAPRDTQ